MRVGRQGKSESAAAESAAAAAASAELGGTDGLPPPPPPFASALFSLGPGGGFGGRVAPTACLEAAAASRVVIVGEVYAQPPVVALECELLRALAAEVGAEEEATAVKESLKEVLARMGCGEDEAGRLLGGDLLASLD